MFFLIFIFSYYFSSYDDDEDEDEDDDHDDDWNNKYKCHLATYNYIQIWNFQWKSFHLLLQVVQELLGFLHKPKTKILKRE